MKLTITESLALAQIKVPGRTPDAAKEKGLKCLDHDGLRKISLCQMLQPMQHQHPADD